MNTENTSDSVNNIERLEAIIQFAAKSEPTSQLQSYWYNKYLEVSKNKLFEISSTTISNILQADEVQKPITPFASINLIGHINQGENGKITIDEGKIQSTLDVLVRLLDAILDSVNFNAEAKFLVQEYRKIGISVAGFNQYLAIKSDAVSASYETDYIGSLISNGVYRASESLAEEKGVCQGWENINRTVKPKSFEYWYNIDTGEIKSGIEISTEFSTDSIKKSKFEIVPRRNSHLLLLSGNAVWEKWNDRENIAVSTEPEISQTPNEANLKNNTYSDSKVVNVTEESKIELDKELEVFSKVEMPDSTSGLGGISTQFNTIQNPNELATGTETVSEDLKINSVGFIRAENSSEGENKNNVIRPTPEMIDLDDLMNNIEDTSQSINKNDIQEQLFNPTEALDQIKQPEVFKNVDNFNLENAKDPSSNQAISFDNAELKVAEEKLNGKEDDKTSKQGNNGFMSKLFKPFGNQKEKSTESETIFEVKDATNQDEIITDLTKPEIFTSENKTENINDNYEHNIENNFDSLNAVFNNPSNENEDIFSIGELVKVTDEDHAKYGQYLQVIDVQTINDKIQLILLDTDTEQDTTILVNSSQVEPASIEQVLIQLNQKGVSQKIKTDVNPVSSNQIPDLSSNPAISFEEKPSSEKEKFENTGTDVKVLLFSLQNEVLLEIKNGNYTVPSLKLSNNNAEKEPKLAISKILYTNYNISDVKDLTNNGIYTDSQTNQIYLAYYGFIKNSSINKDGLVLVNITEAYRVSPQLASLLDNMSEKEKEEMTKIASREKQIAELEKQLKTISENSSQASVGNPSRLDSTVSDQSDYSLKPNFKNNLNSNMNTTTQNHEDNLPNEEIFRIEEFNIDQYTNERSGEISSNHNSPVAQKQGQILVNENENKIPVQSEPALEHHQAIQTNKPYAHNNRETVTYFPNNVEMPTKNTSFNQNYTMPNQSNSIENINNTNNSNTYPALNQNPNMLYQSTSQSASYSKFSVLIKQIISTAEFGSIILHIHYDASGPRVITVELPQLINDSVLQVLRMYINLVNASLIRGSGLSGTVGLIQDQLELAGENGTVSELIEIILKGVNALPKNITELNSTRVLALDPETSRQVVKTGVDPLKALAEKFLNTNKA